MAFIVKKPSVKNGQKKTLHYLVESYRDRNNKSRHFMLSRLGKAQSLSEAIQNIEKERVPLVENLIHRRKELRSLKQGHVKPGLPWVQKMKAENKLNLALKKLLELDKRKLEFELFKSEFPNL